MLRGRESLKKIIGKRKRFLPNLSRILSSSSSSSSNSLKVENDEKFIINDSATKKAELKAINNGSDDLLSVNDFVTCPVCSIQIRGDDRSVNSHLDLCLVKGTKRKLSQRTLLQFSLFSKLKDSKCAIEGVLAESNMIQDSVAIKNDLPPLASISNDKVTCTISQCEMTGPDDGTSLKSPLLAADSISQHANSLKSIVDDSKMVDAYSVALESGSSNFDMEGILSKLSGMVLETCIVGRKYVDAAEVVSGASICFLRDPTNIKDPNAIKTMSGPLRPGCFSRFQKWKSPRFSSSRIISAYVTFD